jgi:hypothetical protein
MKTQNTHHHMQHSVCGSITALAVGMFLLLGQSNTRAQWDNWDDGNDLSPSVTWTHFDPIFILSGGASVPNTFDASSGQYHLVANGANSSLGFAAARAYSLPLDPDYTNYSDFYVSVDVVGWSVLTAQGFGLLARATDLGPATTDGYFLGLTCGVELFGGQNFVRMYRLQNEGLATVNGSGPNGTAAMYVPALDPAKAYRMIFMGRGTDLEGRVYELPNVTTPIAVVYGNTAGDTTILTNGACGLLALDLSGVGADVYFDNYYASSRVPLKITDMVVKDNFNDGNDTSPVAWMHYDPIWMIGTYYFGPDFPHQGTWSFPGNNTYRLQASPSPDPVGFGPARAGSIDASTSQGNSFRVAVDLVSFDPNLDMAFGFMTHITDIGPGATDAHAMTFQTRANWHDFDLIRIVNESPDDPGVNFDLGAQQDRIRGIDMSTNTFRFVFTGQGNVLRGLIFMLPETMNPLVDCVATDTNLPAYTSGPTALFGFDNSDTHDKAVDVTFDNYSDTAISPPTVTLTVGSAPTGAVTITWPANNEGIWVLESSPTLGPGAVWTKVTTGKLIYDPVTGKYTFTGAAAMSTAGDTFYRLIRV